mgnify:CR=1 FL=1
MSEGKTRTLKVDYMARVEGEGAFHVRLRGDQVEEVALKIFEPPRFFEAFLRGRDHREPPDITARICGICPIAYQMSAVSALEDALGVAVGGTLRDLRLLMYCGEWIESHMLHVYMLHAPDFLGYPDAITLARDDAARVKQGLLIKKTGNELVRLLGGREIHPVSVKVGGFHRTPTRDELLTLREPLLRARDEALDAVRWTASLPCPELERDVELVSVWHPTEYPMLGERIVSSGGLDIPVAEYELHFEEIHEQRSNALFSRLRGRPGRGNYLAGPLARFALAFDKLTPLAREAARGVGLTPPCRNPFRSIVVRAVETVHALDLALQLIERYERPAVHALDYAVRAGTGHGVSEAPRGLLYHRYELDAQGLITAAQIVPPTSQNQASIEEDLRQVVQASLHLDDAALTARCEQTIRNYDPCISCATHFLRLTVERLP